MGENVRLPGFPVFPKGCSSLLSQILTRNMYMSLLGLKTAKGSTLPDCIYSGVQYLDHPIGVLAADSECYPLFWALFEPIIARLHPLYSSNPNWYHPEDLDPRNLRLAHVRIDASRVKCVRLSVVRNLFGTPMAPTMTTRDRIGVCTAVFEALRQLKHRIPGVELSLEDVTEDLKLCDELESLGVMPRLDKASLGIGYMRGGTQEISSDPAEMTRDQLSGRGIFVNNDEGRSLCAWVNTDVNHLRISCTENVGQEAAGQKSVASAAIAAGLAFSRLAGILRGLTGKRKSLRFDQSPQLGYITCSPSELGTGMTASFVVVLRQAPWCPGFDEVCAALGVVVEPVSTSSGGWTPVREASHSEGGSTDGERKDPSEHKGVDCVKDTFLVSNRLTLGISEVQTLQALVRGVERLIEVDDQSIAVLGEVPMDQARQEAGKEATKPSEDVNGKVSELGLEKKLVGAQKAKGIEVANVTPGENVSKGAGVGGRGAGLRSAGVALAWALGL